MIEQFDLKIEQESTSNKGGRAEPFIKWAGGKQALVKQLTPHFPVRFKKFVEPFVGGGAVFFSLGHSDAVISDQNEWLIDTYIAIRDDWKAVAKKLDKIPNTKDDFLKIRSTNRDKLDLYTRAAHFIYLNKTCFRGLFRVNKFGQFNVPYGEYNRRYYSPENLEAASKALRKTMIQKGDYESALIGVTDGDFVYFDPPYYKLGGHSDFNRYTSGQFREQDHLRLAAVSNELTGRGVKWAMSNSDTSFIRHLYKQYKFKVISARREINLNSQQRNISELLILNY